ncbi:MAG: hypothetical protein ACRDGL_01125, partial [Candidatus Limnocylindrales bacterium]
VGAALGLVVGIGLLARPGPPVAPRATASAGPSTSRALPPAAPLLPPSGLGLDATATSPALLGDVVIISAPQATAAVPGTGSLIISGHETRPLGPLLFRLQVDQRVIGSTTAILGTSREFRVELAFQTPDRPTQATLVTEAADTLHAGRLRMPLSLLPAAPLYILTPGAGAHLLGTSVTVAGLARAELGAVGLELDDDLGRRGRGIAVQLDAAAVQAGGYVRFQAVVPLPPSHPAEFTIVARASATEDPSLDRDVYVVEVPVVVAADLPAGP